MNKASKPSKDTAKETVFHFEAIGTMWDIKIQEVFNLVDMQSLEAKIRERIEQFDKDYSRFRSDSYVTTIANDIGEHQLPVDAQPLMDLYEQLYTVTDGRMSPLVGHLLEDAGYDANYSLIPKEFRNEEKWEETIEYAYPTITIKNPTLLDFGAAGKGYLVDLIGTLLLENHVYEFIINAGGDILHHSKSNSSITVGLENPEQTDQVIGVANIVNKSICGSAGNRRAWGEFNHIIDPTTQRPSTELKAVWVIANSALLADGLTTALYFKDGPTLQQSFDFEYAILKKDSSLEYSNKFPAEFFQKDRE
jgi:thiamine biosynthesis lipoprotein